MKVERCCKNCRGKFTARKADVDRGWALFCSKSCKAAHQERRTGNYRRLLSEDAGSFINFETDDGLSALFPAPRQTDERG